MNKAQHYDCDKTVRQWLEASEPMLEGMIPPVILQPLQNFMAKAMRDCWQKSCESTVAFRDAQDKAKKAKGQK